MTKTVNEWPTVEHKEVATEAAIKKIGHRTDNQTLFSNIEGLIKSFMLELQSAGEIRRVPSIRCTLTQTGEKINEYMEWVPVYNENSITVHFQNPDTLDYV